MSGIGGVDYLIGDMAASSSFGRRLARLRRREGLSQEALAERADLSRNYIGNLESGRQQPSLPNALALARTLGVEIGALIQDIASSIHEEDSPSHTARTDDARRRKHKIQRLLRRLETSSMRQLDAVDDIIHHILGAEKTGSP